MTPKSKFLPIYLFQSVCINTLRYKPLYFKAAYSRDFSQCNSAVNNLNDEVDSVRTITVKQTELCAV